MVLIDNRFIDMDNWYNRLIDNEMIIDCSAISGAFWILNSGPDELPYIEIMLGGTTSISWGYH